MYKQSSDEYILSEIIEISKPVQTNDMGVVPIPILNLYDITHSLVTRVYTLIFPQQTEQSLEALKFTQQTASAPENMNKGLTTPNYLYQEPGMKQYLNKEYHKRFPSDSTCFHHSNK